LDYLNFKLVIGTAVTPEESRHLFISPDLLIGVIVFFALDPGVYVGLWERVIIGIVGDISFAAAWLLVAGVVATGLHRSIAIGEGDNALLKLPILLFLTPFKPPLTKALHKSKLASIAFLLNLILMLFFTRSI